MQFSPLSLVKHRVGLGAPLPFNIRDNDGTLLLARGQWVEHSVQLEALLERGALVDLAELRSAADNVRLATPAELPGLWTRCLGELSQTLRKSAQNGFLAALDDAAPPVLALVERDKDLAIFQILRQEGNVHVQYGVNHATHAAITAYLVANRLSWSPDEATLAFKAALTMNISMLELQGQLAVQAGPPSDEQREAVRAHPEFSRWMLEISGVTDADWLTAVSQHHEHEDGSGYPRGLREINDLAALVRRADIYTAKLAPRTSRPAMLADQAVRMMFVQDPGNSMTAALVKEFGVYPPGCFVKLMSGETGVVVQRGATVMTPIVAVLSTPMGASLPQPQRRDTSLRQYAVHSVLGNTSTGPGVSTEALIAVATV